MEVQPSGIGGNPPLNGYLCSTGPIEPPIEMQAPQQ